MVYPTGKWVVTLIDGTQGVHFEWASNYFCWDTFPTQHHLPLTLGVAGAFVEHI